MAEDARAGVGAPVAGLDSVEGFRALVELSPDAVFVILDGYHVFANARGLALFGARGLAELRTRPAHEFMHPSCRDDARLRMRTMVDDRAPLQYVEERVIRLDGTVVDIEAAGTPIEVGGRSAALVVVRDITARKQAEAALRVAQARFQAAFRHAPSAIVLVDEAGAVVAANPTMGRMLGRQADGMLGQPCWDIAAPIDRAAVRSSFANLSAGASTAISGDFRFDRPDGGTGWAHARATPLAGETLFIVHLLDVTAAKQAERQLAVRAERDPLTGLDNRSRVLDRLATALRRPGADVSVLFCDLDGFKLINDRYGHAVGDEVLVIIARRMRAALSMDDPMGRIGGDEFAVVLSGEQSGDLATRIAGRIRQAVAEPMAVAGVRLRLGISIGMATARAGSCTAEALLAAADTAMYQDKAATRVLAGGATAGTGGPSPAR